MSQKKALAYLVASLLLAMNVVYADTAILVADGVLVKRTPRFRHRPKKHQKGKL